MKVENLPERGRRFTLTSDDFYYKGAYKSPGLRGPTQFTAPFTLIRQNLEIVRNARRKQPDREHFLIQIKTGGTFYRLSRCCSAPREGFQIQLVGNRWGHFGSDTPQIVDLFKSPMLQEMAASIEEDTQFSVLPSPDDLLNMGFWGIQRLWIVRADGQEAYTIINPLDNTPRLAQLQASAVDYRKALERRPTFTEAQKELFQTLRSYGSYLYQSGKDLRFFSRLV